MIMTKIQTRSENFNEDRMPNEEVLILDCNLTLDHDLRLDAKESLSFLQQMYNIQQWTSYQKQNLSNRHLYTQTLCFLPCNVTKFPPIKVQYLEVDLLS